MGFYITDEPRNRGPRAAEPPWGPKPVRGPIREVISGYRFYNPDLGRWESRDPIGEVGGINLFVFVGNRAIYEYDLLGQSWPGVMAKCGLEALKKVIGHRLGKELKGARLCEKIADHISLGKNEPCDKISFPLKKEPLSFDTANWGQVALSCILGAVKKAGGIDDFIENIDDKSKRKFIEKLMEKGEGKLSDLLEDQELSLDYSISYQCDSKKSVLMELETQTSIEIDGEVYDLPFTAGEDNENYRCRETAVMWSKWIGSFCCGCESLPDDPPDDGWSWWPF